MERKSMGNAIIVIVIWCIAFEIPQHVPCAAVSLKSSFRVNARGALQQAVSSYTHRPYSLRLIMPSDFAPIDDLINKDFETALGESLGTSAHPSVRYHVLSKELRKVQSWPLYAIISIILLPESENVMSLMFREIIESTSRQRDRIILLGSRTALRKAFENDKIYEFAFKTGVDVDSGEIVLEPVIFENVGKTMSFGSMDAAVKATQVHQMGARLRGRHLKAVGCEFPPWIFRIKDEVSGKERFAGDRWEILQAAIKQFNVTFEYKVLRGPQFGKLHPNGTWTGMYSYVYYHDRGYAMTFFLGQTDLWAAWVDYATPLGTVELPFIQATPTRNLSPKAIFQSYDHTVWTTMFVFVILLAVLMHTFGRVQGSILANYYRGTPKSFPRLTFVRALFIPYTILTEQDMQPPATEGINLSKFLVGIWMISNIILGTGYKSNLKSHLIFPMAEKVPGTYRELVSSEFRDYTIQLYATGSVEYEYWKLSTSSMEKALFQRFKFPKTLEDCITNAFLQKKTICIYWSGMLDIWVAMTVSLNSMKTMVFSQDVVLRHTMSMAFQKDSPYRDSFAPITGALLEAGFMSKWDDQVFYHFKQKAKVNWKDKKDSPVYKKLVFLASGSDLDRKPLKMSNLYVVFYIVIVGSGAACLSLCIEIIKGGRGESRERQKEGKTSVGTVALSRPINSYNKVNVALHSMTAIESATSSNNDSSLVSPIVGI